MRRAEWKTSERKRMKYNTASSPLYESSKSKSFAVKIKIKKARAIHLRDLIKKNPNIADSENVNKIGWNLVSNKLNGEMLSFSFCCRI